ncbi:MFS transporter [Bacillus sp. CGMCC 1.16541]|uniref:MFS transporter n=1 Tax=Bacillus sp. CGMCC 1.16541 TaxID=2185143 RepID=UPI000D735D02|nr:MFS transporter [Bacillus sp. CGMCC 1.16541]
MNQFRFWILVSIVAISGFSQGMLLPLLAVMLEKSGTSSSLNGLNAAALYIGILLASPFMEQPLRKFGYRPIIIFGGLLVFVSIGLFPLWHSFWFWFVLRLFIGIGDHALHFATQTWITSSSPHERRGRNIALYGLFFGIGFAAGPLMTPLVDINPALPFMLSSALCLIGWAFVFFLKNEYPEQDMGVSSFSQSMKRFSQAWKYAWVAFLPPLGYGILETSINGIFPVYGLRIGMEVKEISFLLTAFAVGGILTQLPLGIISDRYGRRNILTFILFFGFLAFLGASFMENSFIGLVICLSFAGMLLGSTFSLGISYMTDLTPAHLLPTGNLMCGIFFSIGSLIGPFVGGFFIQYVQQLSFFHILSGLILLIFCAVFFSKKGTVVATNSMEQNEQAL